MPLMKAMEELGELASAHLRGIQNPDKLDVYDAAAKDAVADTLIALIGYASRRGWSVAELLSDVWPEVRGRSQARLRR